MTTATQSPAKLSRECLGMYDVLSPADKEYAREIYEAAYWVCKNHYLGLAAPTPKATDRLIAFRNWLQSVTR